MRQIVPRQGPLMGWTGCTPSSVSCGATISRSNPMTQTHQRPAQDIAVIGVDIGKDVFHLVGFDSQSKIAFRRKIKRLALIDTFTALPPCIVGMEACLSAHFVARTLRKLGHEPRIIPAKYSKPFVKGQKNDYNDAEAIAEAALRPISERFAKRPRKNSTFRPTTAYARGLSRGAPRPSTRSERFLSSKASRSGRARMLCACRFSRS